MPLLVDLMRALDGRPPGAAVVRLAGKDARRFCNGMFTNNVRDLPVGAGNRSAMVDSKGRPFGLLDLYCESDASFLGVLDGMTFDEFEQRFGKFIVFDDVELTDLTPKVALWTLQGDGAEALLADEGWPVPGPGHRSVGPEGQEVVGLSLAFRERDHVVVTRRSRGVGEGFDVLVPKDASCDPSALASGATLGTSADLDVLRVEAGRVRWPVDFTAGGAKAPLVHEVGLRDEVCSFEKGCYVGQEVIHRVDVMGTVRKTLAGVRLEADPGVTDAELRADGQAAGRVTSIVTSPRYGVIGLAVVKKPLDTPGTRVEVVAGERSIGATIAALPFGR